MRSFGVFFWASVFLLEDMCWIPGHMCWFHISFLNFQSSVAYYSLLTLFLGPFCLFFKMIPNPKQSLTSIPPQNKTLAWAMFITDEREQTAKHIFSQSLQFTSLPLSLPVVREEKSGLPRGFRLLLCLVSLHEVENGYTGIGNCSLSFDQAMILIPL